MAFYKLFEIKFHPISWSLHNRCRLFLLLLISYQNDNLAECNQIWIFVFVCNAAPTRLSFNKFKWPLHLTWILSNKWNLWTLKYLYTQNMRCVHRRSTIISSAAMARIFRFSQKYQMTENKSLIAISVWCPKHMCTFDDIQPHKHGCLNNVKLSLKSHQHNTSTHKHKTQQDNIHHMCRCTKYSNDLACLLRAVWEFKMGLVKVNCSYQTYRIN